jgi:hypothetical protein
VEHPSGGSLSPIRPAAPSRKPPSRPALPAVQARFTFGAWALSMAEAPCGFLFPVFSGSRLVSRDSLPRSTYTSHPVPAAPSSPFLLKKK